MHDCMTKSNSLRSHFERVHVVASCLTVLTHVGCCCVLCYLQHVACYLFLSDQWRSP